MGFVRLPAGLESQRDACLEAPRAAAQGRALHAIVDLASATDADHWCSRLAASQHVRSLFDGQPESAARLQAPWLLLIEPDDMQLNLRRTVDEALAAWNVSWVASALSLPELATRLSRRLAAQLSGEEVLFRYYDPRLFPDWWAGLSREQRLAFGAFGTTWWTLDADEVLRAFPLAGEPNADPVRRPWLITSSESEVLTTTSELHQLMGFLSKRRPDMFIDLDRGQRWRFVRTHDAGAKAHKLTSLADRLKYCELALDHGEDFAEQPSWQRVWAAMAGEDLRFANAVELPKDDTSDVSVPTEDLP